MCYCDTDKAFAHCCQPVLANPSTANQPVTLMRARFSAHYLGDNPFLQRTATTAMQSTTLNTTITWIKLEIINAPTPHRLRPHKGSVCFNAYYEDAQGITHVLHETSVFRFKKHQWYYTGATDRTTDTPTAADSA